MGRYRKEEKIKLMNLFDNIRKMDDTEIVVFLHNLGIIYMIEQKGIYI